MAKEFTREFFQKAGKKGGKKGGALAWEGLSDAERSERAKQAVAKRKWHPVKAQPASAGTAPAKPVKTATKRKP